MPRTDLTGWTIPKYAELVARVESDYDAGLEAIRPDSNPIVYSTLVGVKPVFCKIIGGASYLIHELGAYVVRQVFVQHSDSEFLDAHGTNRGYPRKPGTFAVRTIEATGVNSATIPEGSKLQFVSGEQSLSFVTLEDATISSGTAEITIQAEEPGTPSNLVAGSVLYFSNSIVGVDSATTIIASSADQDGVDLESDDAYASRMLDSLSSKGSPASPPSLREIAESVSGIESAWVLRSTPYPGDATILVTASSASSTGGIPDDDGAAYHLPCAVDSSPDPWIYIPKASLDTALGRTALAGDFAGGSCVTNAQDPLNREIIECSYSGLVEHNSTTWKILLDRNPTNEMDGSGSVHLLGPIASTVFGAVYESFDSTDPSQTVHLPADGMDVLVKFPEALELTMTIGLPDNTLAMRNAILESLHSMVSANAKPGGSITSWMVRNAIMNSEGHVNHSLNLFMGNSGDYTSVAGTQQLHVLSDSNVSFTTM